MTENHLRNIGNLHISLNEEQNQLFGILVEEILRKTKEKLAIENDNEKILYKGKEICELIGISWGTFLKLKTQGLPTVILNTGNTGMEMYSRESVTSWLMEHEVRI